jgi:hypothetical protein
MPKIIRFIPLIFILIFSLFTLSTSTYAEPSNSNNAVIKHYETQGSMNDVSLLGNKAYIAAGSEGLIILDISNPSEVIRLGQFATNNYLYEVALSNDGTTAYLAEGKSLVIIDVTDPANITELNRINAGETGYIEAVTLSPDGNQAYIANGWTGFHILNVSDPLQLSQLGFFATQGYVGDITVSADNRKVYIADVWNGVIIMDVTTPATPTLIAQFSPLSASTGKGFSRNIVLSDTGSTAYVIDSTDGLLILDLTDPSQPTLLGQYLNPLGVAADIARSADGSKVYIADAKYGGASLISVDVSDPAQAKQLKQLALAQAVSMTLSSDETTAYIAGRSKGLFVIDPQKLN